MPTAGGSDIAFGDLLTFRSPVPLQRTGARGIDTDVGTWQGEGVRVLIDHGPFADPLLSYDRIEGAVVSEETVGGQQARVVGLDRGRDGAVAAVHFASLGGPGGRLTMTVESDGAVDAAALLAMVRSIRFTEEVRDSDSSRQGRTR